MQQRYGVQDGRGTTLCRDGTRMMVWDPDGAMNTRRRVHVRDWVIAVSKLQWRGADETTGARCEDGSGGHLT